MESHIGSSIQLTKCIKTMDRFNINDVNKIKELNKAEAEQLFVSAYLKKMDQYKYGSNLKGLIRQKLLRNDQYPKTISEANNIISNDFFDNTVK